MTYIPFLNYKRYVYCMQELSRYANALIMQAVSEWIEGFMRP